VLGDDRSHVFPVEISASKNVGALKKAIKREKKHTLDHVDVDALVLWSISIPDDETLEKELIKLELVDERALSPMNRLSNKFSCVLKEGHLHIIVKAPPTGMCPCPNIVPLCRCT
jgi:Crinkler effector protein N-terminal domain